MDLLVQIFRKIKSNYNNSLESWNKGLIISYTIFSAVTDNVTYQWEITNILTQDEVHLPCYLVPNQYPETQLCRTFNILK